MSKLIDRLKETATGGRAIGFPVGKTHKVPPMLVLVEVGSLDVDAAERAVAAGVSGLVVRVPGGQAEDLTGSRREVLAALLAAADGRPLGLAFDGPVQLSRDAVAALTEGGVDFILMQAEEMPAALLDAAKVATVVTVQAGYTDTQLRSLGELEVDAVHFAVAPSQPSRQGLTIADMVQYQRLALLVHKPSIAAVTAQLSPDDVAQLHALGVQALLLDAAAAGQVGNYVAAIAKIKPKSKSRHRGSSFTPAIGRSLTAGAAQPDEDDDDEE